MPRRSPRRVKVTGDLFHGRVPDGAVYIGRPAVGLTGSPYRNMFTARKVDGGFRVWDLRARRWCGSTVLTQFEAVTVAAMSFDAATGSAGEYAFDPDVLRFDLAGRDLACWCDLVYGDGFPVPCHGNALLQRANVGR